MNRLACCVPFCRRTRADDGVYKEWICGVHWRGVDRRVKWMTAAVRRRVKRGGWTPTLLGIAGRTWERAKRQAIERAAGIG